MPVKDKNRATATGSFGLVAAISICAAMLGAITAVANSHGFPGVRELVVPMAFAVLYGPAWLLVQRIYADKHEALTPLRTCFAFLSGLLPLALNLPYLWYRSAATSASHIEFIANSVTITAELLLGALLVITMFRLLGKMEVDSVASESAERPWRVLVPAMAIWIITGATLSILMHRFMHESGPNTTMIIQGLENLFDPRGPLYAQVLQADGSSILGVHANFIFFFLYPFYLIAPHYETVLILGQIAMAAAVIPIYKLARSMLSYRVSMLISFIYLTTPVIAGSGATQDMSELRFLAFPFFISLLYFKRNRFLPFLAFSFIAILTREDVGLLYFLLGAYSFFIHKDWRWRLVPLIGGAAWFALMTNVVIPHFNPAGTFARLGVVYEEYGGTQLGLIKHLATHPWVIFSQMFANPSTVGLTFGFWQTIGLGVPLLSGLVILTFPGMAELLLLESGARPSINSHHAIIIAVPMFASLIFAMVRFESISSRYESFTRGQLTLIATVIMLFSSVSAFHVWFNPDRYAPRYNYDDSIAMMDMIPEGASAILPMYMLIHSADDLKAVGYYQIAYRVDLAQDLIREDYIIIDTDIPSELAHLRVYSGLAALRDDLRGRTDYKLIASDGNLELYKRSQVQQ
ncbi:MAG: DUF2079 domain-containing protein [Thermoleophilia bacterium]